MDGRKFVNIEGISTESQGTAEDSLNIHSLIEEGGGGLLFNLGYYT